MLFDYFKLFFLALLLPFLFRLLLVPSVLNKLEKKLKFVFYLSLFFLLGYVIFILKLDLNVFVSICYPFLVLLFVDLILFGLMESVNIKTLFGFIFYVLFYFLYFVLPFSFFLLIMSAVNFYLLFVPFLLIARRFFF